MKSFSIIAISALGLSPARGETPALFSTANVRRMIAESHTYTTGGDWYDAEDGGVLRQADLALVSHYLVSHRLLDSPSALAGLKDQRAYVRVICHRALAELLHRDIAFPHLEAPEAPASRQAYARLAKLVRARASDH